MLAAILAGCSAAVVPAAAEGYRDKKMREMAGDLRRSRESLHRAHQELARKAERISILEALLKENKIEIPVEAELGAEAVPELSSRTERKLSDAISKIRELESRLLSVDKPVELLSSEKKVVSEKGAVATVEEEVPSVKEEKMAEKAAVPTKAPEEDKVAKKEDAAKEPAGAMIVIRYESDSAVSRDGRERALEFVKGVLARSPQAVFRVEGGADDSQYESSDEVIAGNRARFLVDYLKYREIPAEVFQEVGGTSSKEKEGPKKFVRVSVISG